jgi:probable F420-dependent oxidoreductase
MTLRIGVSLPVRELKDDLGAIRDFASLAEELGFTHLRIPEQIVRKDSGHLHEPLALLAYLAGLTSRIELVPSVLVLPARQTALVAKQAAEIDVLSGGRLRLGVGVGNSRREFQALGQDFQTRGRRCSEQMLLLKQLWTQEVVDFEGEFHELRAVGIDPLPIQRPIPMWIGAASVPSAPVLRRIGEHADGWFALCSPEQYPDLRKQIDEYAGAAGRKPSAIGAESGLGIHGRTEAEWLDILAARQAGGITHLCMRTLGGELDAKGHLEALAHVHRILRDEGHVEA